MPVARFWLVFVNSVCLHGTEDLMSLRRFLSILAVSAVALSAPSLLSAQSQDAPKVEVFGGYSWYHPGGTLDPVVINGSLVPGGNVPDFKKGWGGQFTYNLNHWAGIALDTTGHYNDFGNAHSLAFGPQFKWRSEHFTPFAEAFVGVQHLSPKLFPDHNGATIIAGGGLEYPITRRFTLRPAQVDYLYAYYNGDFPHGRSDRGRRQ